MSDPKQAGPKRKEYEPRTQQQRLGYFVEECGEVLAAVGKTIRWGLDSYNPELPEAERETNREWIKRELGDLKAAIERLEKLLRPAAPPEAQYPTPNTAQPVLAGDPPSVGVPSAGSGQTDLVARLTAEVERLRLGHWYVEHYQRKDFCCALLGDRGPMCGQPESAHRTIRALNGEGE